MIATLKSPKTYLGTLDENKYGGRIVYVIPHDGPRVPRHLLDPRAEIANHSPDGFNWGYGGSGPAQLALAICCDALGDNERAQRVYQRFKFQVIGNLDPDLPWELSHDAVVAKIGEIETAEVKRASEEA